MNFVPNDYVSPSESIILSGTVNIGYINSPKYVKLILTNRKIITAGDDHLQIIPLNQISGISGSIYQLCIWSAGGSGDAHAMAFYYVDNPSAYSQIVQEISKRIG